MAPVTPRWFKFGDYRLDALSGILLKSDHRVSLRPKTTDTLRVLLEGHGDLVSKDILLREVWPGSFVEEAGLARNISELRNKLGTHNGRNYIETIPKRGYRIAVSVQAMQDAGSSATPRLMVVPFASATGTSNEAIRSGFHDVLLARLNSIRELRIEETAGHSSHENSAKPTSALETKPDYFLKGRITERKNQIQVSVRLIDVKSANTIWAEAFQEPVDDPLQAKESICEEIAGALALKFGAYEGKLLNRRYANNSEAHQAYLRGRYHWNRRTVDGFRAAIEHFERAIERDPEYAPAFSGLADCYAMLPMVSALPPRKYMPKAKSAALNALDIDETLAEARSSLAFVKWHYDWNWAAAERDFKRILKFHPGRAISHLSYALLLVEQGRAVEALEQAHKALRLEPDSVSIAANFAMVLHLATHDADAITAAREVLTRDPHSARARWALGLALQHVGRTQEAVMEFERMLLEFAEMPSAVGSLGFLYGVAGKKKEAQQLLSQLLRESHECPYDLALVYLGLRDVERALQSLEGAYEQRSFHLVMLKVDRRMNALRTHPRFKDLLKRIRLS